MIVCGTNDIVFRERPLRESDLTLSRAISARYAAEETLKHAREIFQSQPNYPLILKPRHQAPNQKSKEITKESKFCNWSHPRVKFPTYGK